MTTRVLPPLSKDPYECLQQGCERPWEVAVDPFEVAPRTYFVGNNWVGAYLIASSNGLILIDSTMQPQVYLLLENVRILGFDPRDIRYVLLSHMHYDHCGGIRVIQEHSGAKVMMSREDRAFMCARPEMIFDEGYPFGAFEPDGYFSDEQPIVLGDRAIRTMLTPGHTPGTTSFFFDATDANGHSYFCGMHGGVGLNTLADGFLRQHGLSSTTRDDYLASMLKVRDIPVEITLGSHPAQVGMMEKVGRIRSDHNPFFDPTVWKTLIDGRIAQVRQLMEKDA